MNRQLYFRMISQSSLSSRDKLGLIQKQLWTLMAENASSAMEVSTRWMRAAWQLLPISSKVLMNLLKATRTRGILPQCSFCEILCFECGGSGAIMRGTKNSIHFGVCDECFEHWDCMIIPSSDAGKWSVILVYPYKCLLLSSSTLKEAVRFTIEFTNISVDKNGSKKWKKDHQKRL